MATVINNTGIVFPDGTSQADSTIIWQAVQATGFTAAVDLGYPCNTTSAAFTVTLPASPVAGDKIALIDYAGTFATNNLTINPNGNKINTSTSNFFMNVARQAITLVYIDTTQGWLVFNSTRTTPPIKPIYTATYLAVGGGGGGGGWVNSSHSGAGGGAGGFLTGTASFVGDTVYTITVGGSGAGGVFQGSNGTSSIISGGAIATVTSLGGGGGGGNTPGRGGGSGGGGGNGTPGTRGGGIGTPGQGNPGGAGGNPGCGGGGGASAAGGSTNPAINPSWGSGGAGLPSSITGSSVFYAGGGGSAGNVGGIGGGANGQGSPGITNTGGGGAGVNGVPAGTNGGTGVVILSVPTASYRGVFSPAPVVSVTTSGVNTILQFNNSGTYTG